MASDVLSYTIVHTATSPATHSENIHTRQALKRPQQTYRSHRYRRGFDIQHGASARLIQKRLAVADAAAHKRESLVLEPISLQKKKKAKEEKSKKAKEEKSKKAKASM